MNDTLSISRLAKILVKNGCGSSYISSEIERSNGQKYGLFKNFRESRKTEFDTMVMKIDESYFKGVDTEDVTDVPDKIE